MTPDEESVLDDLFHGCALAAFVQNAIAQQGWPDPGETNALACRLYEYELAVRQTGFAITGRVGESASQVVA